MTNASLLSAGINIGPIYGWLSGIVAVLGLLIVFVVVILKWRSPPE